MCRTRSQTLRNLRQRVTALSSPHMRSGDVTTREYGQRQPASAHRHRQSRCRPRARQRRRGGARDRQDDQRAAVRSAIAHSGDLGHPSARCHHPGRRPFPRRGVGRCDHIHPVSGAQQPDRSGIRDTHRGRHHLGHGPPLALRRSPRRLGTVRPTRTRSGKRRRRHGEARRHRTPSTQHRPAQPVRPTAHPQGSEGRHTQRFRCGRRRARRERREKRHDIHRLP